MPRCRTLALLALIALFHGTAQAQTATARILVVPFEDTQREPRLVWLGEAAAVVLADELNARGRPAFTRPERVQAFDQLHLPVSAVLSRATVIKVGQILGASEVVWGCTASLATSSPSRHGASASMSDACSHMSSSVAS